MSTLRQVDKTQASRVVSYLPIIGWLKQYTRDDFHSDLFAGIITAILLVPQGIAYAMLAGLPAQLGLYASILPPAVYAFLGTSRTLSVGPVSIAAIMIASALATPEVQAFGSTTESAFILAAEGGIILLAMALMRMGGLVNFISHPVLTGFTSGASILIVISQLPHLFGIKKPVCGVDIQCFQGYFLQTNSYTLGLAALSLGILVFFGKPLTVLLKHMGLKESLILGISKCAPLLVVVVTTLLVLNFNLADAQSVAIVGEIQSGLPVFDFSFINDLDKWKALLPYAAFIAIIAYVESVAIAKVTANLRKQRINPNQELIAIGAANLATAFTGGMSVAGGFSRTMVNFSAGARTQMSMIIAVIILSVAVIFFTAGFTYIPKVALAAIILIAIMPLMRLRDIFTTWYYDKGDGIAELITLLGVLILGIEEGLALGIMITIGSYLRRTSLPHIAVVGRINNTEHFRNIERYQVKTWDNLLLIRIDENITFANASFITDFIQTEIFKRSHVDHVVLIFTSVSYIDTTAFEALESLNHTLKSSNIVLNLAEVKGPVMDRIEKTDFLQQLEPGAVFMQVNDAVTALAKAE
jgi:sulfate permease, SulP family